MKTKTLTPYVYFAPPNLQTWLRSCTQCK